MASGKTSRRKGHEFERKIARQLRERFPRYADDIRRADQGHGANASDVTGLPLVWLELQHAATPTPVGKLEQAERDILEAPEDAHTRIPVAVTHKSRTHTTQATLRLRGLLRLVYAVPTQVLPSLGGEPVTLDWEDFLKLYTIYAGHTLGVDPTAPVEFDI